MAIDFLNPETTHLSNGSAKLSGHISALSKKLSAAKGIITSKNVTGIELRMLPPLVKDNHTAPVWPFPGYAQLYCLTLVVSDVTNQLAGAIDLKGFPRIGDNENLPINKTVFYWQSADDKSTAPSQVHIMCSVLKSKKSLRDIGEILGKVKGDDDYKGLITSLGKLAKDAARFNVVTDILTGIAGVVGKYLGGVEDKPIGTVINSYTSLHGDFDKIGINALTYKTKDLDFFFELVVRSKSAEETIAKEISGKGLVHIPKTKINLSEVEDVKVDLVPF